MGSSGHHIRSLSTRISIAYTSHDTAISVPDFACHAYVGAYHHKHHTPSQYRAMHTSAEKSNTINQLPGTTCTECVV
eukprot:1307858-Rhodomonas_salina.2